MAVPQSFGAVTGDRGMGFTRRWAANSGDAVDPYITGYFFTKWAHFPSLGDMYNTTYPSDDAFRGTADVKNALTSSCTSVTMPGGTVNKTDLYGLGGLKYGYPTNVEYDNTLTMRFTEWQGAPIYKIIASWVKVMRDYRTGVATYNTKSNFAASMYYWTTAPDGVSVASAFLFTGLFPLRDPSDQFGHDLTANDKLETDIDFNVDVVWQEEYITNKCQGFANTAKSVGSANAQSYGYEDGNQTGVQ